MEKSILLIEDESSLIDALKRTFEDKGVKIYIAKNGEEGLLKAKEKQPGIILLDLLMPRMKGMEMLRELRKDEWGKHAVVFVLTNFEMVEMLDEANSLGVVDYLVKANLPMKDLYLRVMGLLSPADFVK